MKYKPEEKGTAQIEEILVLPHTLMEVNKSLAEVGEYLELNFGFLDERAESDFNIAKDDYQKCVVLFGNIEDRYIESGTLDEDDLLAILAIINEIKHFVISNSQQDNQQDDNLFGSADNF